MTRQDYDLQTFQQEDPKPEEDRKKKTDFRVFWFIYVPLGALAGFAACEIGQSGAYFFPVWGTMTLFLWAFNR